MKRTLILLACTLVVLGLAAGGLWWMNSYSPDGGEKPATSAAAETVTLFTSSEAPFTQLEVTNPSGSYRLLPQGEQYTVEGYEAQHLNQVKLKSAVETFHNVTATVVDAQPQDLAQFGLATPQATATAQFGDASFTLTVGGQAPGSSSYYAMVPGDSSLYLVYGLESLFWTEKNFITTILTSPPDPTGQSVTLPQSVTLDGAVRPQPLVLGSRETTQQEQMAGISGLVILSHNNKELDYDKGAKALATLLSVTADKALVYKPTDEQLAQYGLAEPYSTADFTWLDAQGREQSCSLRVSQPKDGIAYLVQAGNPVLYEITASKLPWLELQYQDIASRLFLTPFIGDVRTLTVEGPGVEEVYTLSTIQDADGKDDYQAVNSKGAQMDMALFKKLYQCVIGLPGETFTTEAPDPAAQPLLTVTYAYKDGRPDDVLQLLPGPTLQAYVSLNGVTEFLTKSKYADTVLQNIHRLEAGESILSLY